MNKGETMRKAILTFSILCLVASSSVSSDLVITTENHGVPRRENSLYVVFLGERLVANVKLDVFFIAEMPSSKLRYDELSKLTQSTWIGALRWSFVDANGHKVPLPLPRILHNTVRHRGPNAALPSDRDATVDCTTFQGQIDFGPVPAGDYTLRVSIGDLQSFFPVAARTGDEPDARDAYLEMKAGRASTFAEFRDIQMERYHNDSTHIEPVFLALDRALFEGPIEDVRKLLAIGIQKIDERHRAATDPAQARFFEAYLRELRSVEAALPEYFSHRTEWVMVSDFAEGGYVIRDRRSRAIVRRFGEPAIRDFLRRPVGALEN
jgi:hypothetical protein